MADAKPRYPGCRSLFLWSKIKQMKHYLEPAEEESPNLHILHVGTNDLREGKSAEKITDEIIDLAITLKNETNEVTVSFENVMHERLIYTFRLQS